MKLVSITPKNGWPWMFEQPIAMCLTHLVQRYPEYAEMIRNRPKDCFCILDNSIVINLLTYKFIYAKLYCTR